MRMIGLAWKRVPGGRLPASAVSPHLLRKATDHDCRKPGHRAAEPHRHRRLRPCLPRVPALARRTGVGLGSLPARGDLDRFRRCGHRRGHPPRRRAVRARLAARRAPAHHRDGVRADHAPRARRRDRRPRRSLLGRDRQAQRHGGRRGRHRLRGQLRLRIQTRHPDRAGQPDPRRAGRLLHRRGLRPPLPQRHGDHPRRHAGRRGEHGQQADRLRHRGRRPARWAAHLGRVRTGPAHRVGQGRDERRGRRAGRHLPRQRRCGVGRRRSQPAGHPRRGRWRDHRRGRVPDRGCSRACSAGRKATPSTPARRRTPPKPPVATRAMRACSPPASAPPTAVARRTRERAAIRRIAALSGSISTARTPPQMRAVPAHGPP